GMVYIKMLLSPMPNANVTSMDPSEALAMDGVVGILTADDLPPVPAPGNPILTNSPKYVGQPILAIAAETESIAAQALEKIKITYEPLPFTLDPLVSLYPGGPDAFEDMNVATRGFKSGKIKWTARDFAVAGDDKLPMGEPAKEWAYGDIDAGFEKSAYIIDESFVSASNSHHSMEPRSSFSYWENGKCFLHGSSQSQSFMMPALSQMLGIPAANIVYIAEFCGGGFGSKGGPYPTMVLPSHMSKKIGRPCMLRITRAEEYYLGSARSGFQGNVKLGFDESGRLLAADLYIVQQNGPNSGFPDLSSAGGALSLVYTPQSMRWRGIPVMTNRPPCGAQRGPGQNQLSVAVEPLLDKAAKELGIDRLEIRKINAPSHDVLYDGDQHGVTSSYMPEALALGAERFNYAEKIKRSGERNGSKVIGIGVGQAYHTAGSSGFDGLLQIKPDGKLHIHSGVGNLGTYSYATTPRVAAEVLGATWENCVVECGDSRRNLPWVLGQFGSNTSFTTTRTNYVAAIDAKQKIQEIAAMDLGGAAEDYELADNTVFATADPSKMMTFAQLGARAIELGGKYDGHEAPEDIFPLTKEAVTGIMGGGLVGVAKDKLELHGAVPALATGFIMIELDLETGQHEILDYVGTADCGTVLHPQGLDQQIKGGAVMGFGMASMEKAVYDPQNGLPANVGFYQSKPPSILDVPSDMTTQAVDKPDPQNPVGAKGIGEPLMGCAASALVCAISDATDGHLFNRSPIMPDMIINVASDQPQSYKRLQVLTQ
ncbi:MAG: xanthine dehydrogenase family protein molybdopterin-binding subunit, partial [Kordiimonadaceae bacterium]|nr:xanthine dehydrogenase family protein molybdopterin-binding subunit [Kordiimonadaceae bacterium]